MLTPALIVATASILYFARLQAELKATKTSGAITAAIVCQDKVAFAKSMSEMNRPADGTALSLPVVDDPGKLWAMIREKMIERCDSDEVQVLM